MEFKVGDKIDIPARVRPACGGCVARIRAIHSLTFTDPCNKGLRHCLGKSELEECGGEDEDKRFL